MVTRWSSTAVFAFRDDDRTNNMPMTPDSGLAGKVAIVTGGSRGMGGAIVERLAAEGADVTLFYRDRTGGAQEVVAAAQSGGASVGSEQVDVRNSEACAAAVDRGAERAGRIDILVNNAGMIRDNQLAAMDDEDVSLVLDTNIGGVFNVTRAAVPHMIVQRAGKIINLSSVAGEKGGRGQTNYAASKGAVNAFTRALAVELAPRKVTVNAVAPGVIETEMSQDVRELAGEQILGKILLRRFGKPEDVAFAVWFLASAYADYVTGEVLHVDGGFKME